MPAKAAGWRIEPPVSVPVAPGAMSADTAAADPPDEPPRVSRQYRRGAAAPRNPPRYARGRSRAQRIHRHEIRRAARQSSWMSARSLDHLGHREEAMLGLGRVGEHILADITVGHLIVTQPELLLNHRSQRLDPVGVDFSELLDPADDRIQFGYETRELGCAHPVPAA